MDFSYNEEQQMLQDSIGKFVQQDYDFDTRKKIIDSSQGYSPEYWQTFAELGWLTIPFAEEDGGLGGSAVDLMVVMQELGKGIVVEPFMATAVVGGGLLAAAAPADQKEALLASLMGGELQLGFACTEAQGRYCLHDVQTSASLAGEQWCLNGHKAVVLNGEAADQLIVVARTSGERSDKDGLSLFLVDANAAGVRRHGYPTVDGFRAADVWFDNVTLPATALLGERDNALPLIERIIDRATLAICAEAVGALEMLVAKTVEYTKTRKQFGVTLSKFQALQHRMADMYIELEQAKSIVIMAALQLDANAGDAPKAVSAAKSRLGKAARHIGQEAVQLHGGIGVTEELDVGHYFKRVTMIQYLFGSTDYHTQRYIALAG